MHRLKSRVLQKLEHQDVEELTKAMTIVESLLELGAKKSEKYKSSEPRFKPKGNGGGDKDKSTKNGDGKTQAAQKAKFDKPWEKKKELMKCSIRKGLHMVRDCLK